MLVITAIQSFKIYIYQHKQFLCVSIFKDLGLIIYMIKLIAKIILKEKYISTAMPIT